MAKYSCCDVYDPIATGERIMSLYHKSGISMDDLLDACGLESPRCFYGWTSGKMKPGVRSLFVLAGLLGVKLDDLVVWKSAA